MDKRMLLYCNVEFWNLKKVRKMETRYSWSSGDRTGCKCSLEFDVIHVSMFDREVRLSSPLFFLTTEWRAGTGECLISGTLTLLLPASFSSYLLCSLILGGRSANLSFIVWFPLYVCWMFLKSSVQFSLYLLILFKVELGRSLSQNARDEKQWDTQNSWDGCWHEIPLRYWPK